MLTVVTLGLTLAFTVAPIAEAAQWARRERCFIATDGTTHFKGACKVGDRKNGETHVVTINRKPQLSAVIRRSEISVWNGPEGDNHLHSYLGVMARKGHCWETLPRPSNATKEDDGGLINGGLFVAKYKPHAVVCAR
jgi:hypothetical protein